MKWTLWILAATLAGCTSVTPPDGPPYAGNGSWIVTAERAAQRVKAGALLLDARTQAQYDAGHLDGAMHAPWLRFSPQTSHLRGLLLADDAELARRIGALGLGSGDAAVVVGDTVSGWGEDGRVVWMLRSLGLSSAVMVDGGHDALVQHGWPVTSVNSSRPAATFTISRPARHSIDRDQLKAQLQQGKVASGQLLLVDTRQRREYDGATPYGEKRGGHVPGAVHLYYGFFINTFGYLRPKSTIEDRLKDAGLSPHKPVVAYCTGGVRSAWFVALLLDLGYADVRNYAGSMWEWSAGSENGFPLTR